MIRWRAPAPPGFSRHASATASTSRTIASSAAVAVGLVGLSFSMGCDGELRFAGADAGRDAILLDSGAPSAPTRDATASPEADATVSPTAATDGSDDASAVGTDATPPPSAGCHADGDCKLTTLHCDGVSGSCVACTDDAQCVALGSRRCDAALHRCIECGVDGDCPSGDRCEPTTRRCVTTCTTLTGCPAATPFCDLTKTMCVRCHSDVECVVLAGNSHTCDTANGLCVDCVDDTQCKVGAPRCDRTRGKCVQCTSSSDCPSATPQCDPVASVCVVG